VAPGDGDALSGDWLDLIAALPRLPALESSVILLSQPLGTVTWGWLVLGERMSWIQAAGMAVVMAGLAVLVLKGMVRGADPAAVRPAP
jgi:drug/metabolite transporter (DMT)-like permease